MSSHKNRNGFRTALYLLCWESAFATAFDAWVGVNYLSGLSGEFNVPIHIVTLLIAVPWIGAIGQLAGIFAFNRIPSAKRYAVGLAMACRAVWILPPFLALYWWLQPDPFPTHRWFVATAVIASISSLLGASSASAWSAWAQSIIPGHLRGRFFGIRQRFNMGAIIVANLIGAAIISWKPGGAYAGYFLIAVLGLISAGLSTYLLSKVPDAESFHPATATPEPTLRKVLEPLKNREFRNVLILGAAFNGVVQLTGPYFPYYFTKELQVPMSLIALWIVLTQVGGFASASWWGRRIDRAKSPAPFILVAANLIALAPLFYVVRGAEMVKLLAPFDYAVNGVAWTGYTLAFTTLLFRVCPKGRSAIYFSVYTAAAGLAGLAGNFAGGILVEALQPWGGFRALFFVGGTLRFAVIWSLYGLIKPAVLDRKNAVLELEERLDKTGSEPSAIVS